MRKIYLIIIFTLVAIPVFAYELNHYGNQFSFYIERGFHRIRAPDFFLQGTPGHPELPVKYLHYIIPPNMKVDSIRITIYRTSQISGSYYIYPAQLDVPLCSIPPWVPPDSIIYNSDSLYPNKLVEVFNSGVFDGARLVTIAVHPLQYRPLSRRISLVSNVSFEFRLSPTNIPRRAQRRGINVQRTYDAMLAAAVENDWEIPLYYQPPTLVTDKPPMTLTSTTAAYIIITNDEIPGMMEAFQPFADWLIDKGIPAVVCSLSQILAQPGFDDAEKLRNFILNAYNNGTAWILLGGDGYYNNLTNYIVPFRKGWADDGPIHDRFTPPSDLYFSDLNGNWDVDRDGRWGEPNDDSVDIYPEVFVGRILTYSTDQTQKWVNKILYYEQYGSLDLSYFQQTTWIYDSAGKYPCYPMQQTRDKYPIYFYHKNCKRMYANEVKEELNEGKGFYGIYQHGISNIFWTCGDKSVRAWWPDPSTPQNDGLNYLCNKFRYYVVYDIACYNAAYDKFTPPSPTNQPTDTTIADAFTDTYFEKGAVAFLGNTRYGIWSANPPGPSAYLHDAFCKLLFDEKGLYSLGGAEGWSKVYYPHNYLRHGHNLFGSPENEPWINYPGTMDVVHPDFIPVGQIVHFPVTVTTDAGPLDSVRVCLHKNDVLPYEIYEIGWTDNNGEVTFEIYTSTFGELKVTCFRPRTKIPDKYAQYLPSQTICHVGIDVGGKQAEKSKLPKELSLTVYSSILSKRNLKLSYGLPKDERVKISVYDLSGREMATLKNEKIDAGYYSNAFNLNGLSSGIYWFVLKSGSKIVIKKLALIK